MGAAENKKLVQDVFTGLSEGNGRPFMDLLADDCCWTVTGTTSWSKTYYGKPAIVAELMRPLFAKFADRYRSTAQRFIAEGEHVVVECRGQVTTKAGPPYNNAYCWVCRFADGKIVELTEYLDTELLTTALGDP